MTELSGARYRAGFGHYRQQFVYNVRDSARAGDSGRGSQGPHRRTSGQRDVFSGCAACRRFPGRSCSPASRCRRDRFQTAVIHAVAATPEKTWPAGRLSRSRRTPAAERVLEPVFIGGPGDDLSPFRGYPHRCRRAALARSRSLLAGASLFVGNDSGPAHMAAAFGVPVGGRSSAPAIPAIWGPWRTAGRSGAAHGGIGSVTTPRCWTRSSACGCPHEADPAPDCRMAASTGRRFWFPSC